MSKFNLDDNNNVFLERTSGGNLRISGNYVGSSPCNLNTTGGTITTASVAGSSTLTLTSTSNQNINLSPNGTGTIVTIKDIIMPTVSKIIFRTQTTLSCGAGGSVQLWGSGGTIAGSTFASDDLYINRLWSQLGSSVICTFPAGGITMNNGKNISFTGSTSGTVSSIAAGTTNYSLVLPNAQGAGVLTNDGSGNLSWAVTNRITANTTPYQLPAGDSRVHLYTALIEPYCAVSFAH